MLVIYQTEARSLALEEPYPEPSRERIGTNRVLCEWREVTNPSCGIAHPYRTVVER